MTDPEKIDILLKEYDSLRSELVGRVTYWYQLGALAVLVLGWVALCPLDKRTAIILALLVSLGTFFAALLARDVRILGKRIRQLEKEINTLAGADLLKWETHYGGSATSTYFWRRHPE